ncbi:hypothetical protein VOLCADRAFT_108781, partial [Volvox carteri f. nagariensis]
MCMRLVGMMGYPSAGLPACKLQLRQDSQNQDLFFFEPMDTVSAAAATSAGVNSMFFLDPKGRQIAELKKWLDLAEDEYCMGRPIRPLFINGLVKTGKSYMLKEVLPAVANTYYSSGGSGRQHAGTVLSEPNFLRVNCLGCDRSRGVSGFLKEFLTVLKESAADQRLSAAASTPAPSGNSAVTAAGAIRNFMRRLPRDRLNFLLVDEAQSFYLLERAMPGKKSPGKKSPGKSPRRKVTVRGSTLDEDAVRHMRRIFKGLLLDSPHWVAWAVTGSSMATLWANVAVTPTNGVALITYHSQLNLSPMVSKDVLQVAWEQLKAQAASWDPPLPSDLLWQSPQQIAMLAYLCQEWRGRLGTAITAAELVEQTLRGKLIPEVLADMRMVLQVLGQPTSQVLLLRELVDTMAGVERAKLPLAFEALLANFTTERNGRLYLDNPLFAQVLQAATTESGELLDSITSIPSLSSTMFRELVVLGERCTDKDFDSYEDLHSLLEAMASALALTPDGLLKADWFIQVQDHCNSLGSKTKFERDNRAQTDIKVGLRWFHRLLHNILCHAPILDHQKFLDAYPPEMAAFHRSGRISMVLTKTYEVKPSGGGSSSSSSQHRGSSGTSGKGRSVTAMANKCTPVRPASVAGCALTLSPICSNRAAATL